MKSLFLEISWGMRNWREKEKKNKRWGKEKREEKRKKNKLIE